MGTGRLAPWFMQIPREPKVFDVFWGCDGVVARVGGRANFLLLLFLLTSAQKPISVPILV